MRKNVLININFNMSNNNIKVSIIVLSYNQEKYIQQCIESILCQKVNYKIEIIIGDDASSDNTPMILSKFHIRYSDIIKLVLRKKNIGASANALNLLCMAKGEYVAFIEGDDFWSNPNKLQIQSDFLDTNPQYVGCFHKVNLVDENNVPIYGRLYWLSNKKIFTYNDYDGVRIPGHSSSWLRRNIIKNNEEIYSRFLSVNHDIADRTSILFFLSYGDFARIDGRMGCYRYNRKNGITVEKYKSPEEGLKTEMDFINSLSSLSAYLGRPLTFQKRKHFLFLKSIYTALRYNSQDAIEYAKSLYRDSKYKPLMILSLIPEILFQIYKKVFFLE